MEVEVRTAPDLRDCFVALPLYFIQALQAGRHALPSLVVLELRPLDNSACWHLAWAGAGSRSSSIEVSEKLADCIGLADGIRVSVRALMDVAKAKTVVLEPAGEDDWEILELNAEYVEDHILSQVGILCAGQLFPVLVQGQNALILRVVSTTPKPVVQLVPGAELVVTPKQRKQMHLPSGSLHGKLGNLSDQSFVPSVKAWLRVQELDSSLVQARELEGFQFHIVPTTAIFASSTTAKAIPFINGQLVVLSSAHVPQKKKNNHESSNKLNSGGAKHRLRPESGDREEDSGDDRYAVLRLVYSDLVARGHVMISSALRLFIGSRLHSRVLLRACSQEPNRVQPSIFISPIGFKSKKKVLSVDVNDGSNELSRTNGNFERFQNLEELPEGIHDESAQEWERHNELFMMTADISNVPLEAPWVSMAEDENTLENIGAQKVNTFFKLWATAQMAAISCCEIGQCNSIPMSKEVIMQFQFGSNVVKQRESNYESLFQSKTVANRRGWKKELSTDVCFAVTLNPRDLQADLNDVKQPPSYKGFFLFEEALLAESNSVLEEHVHNTIEKSFKVKLGQPHHILCLSGSSTEESGGPNLSSLTWLEGPASEALSRLRMQLSPKARENSERLGIPSPGYVLLHGPPACGKTKLALAIARQLQEDPSVLAHKVYVRCAELAGEQARTVRATIQEAISEAVEHAPSLIVLDDLDAAIPSGASSESLEPSTTAIMLSEFLADLLDISQVHVKNRIGASISFLAVARAVSTLPACLCFSGRFDFHVALPAPATTELVAIISQELLQRGLSCQDYIVAEIAAKCDGYDAMDLEVLVDRAVHVAAGRFLASPLPELALISSNQVHMNCQKGIGNLSGKKWMMKDMLLQKFELSKEDFSEALKGFVPVSIRGIAKSGGQEGRLGWQDVGGLSDVRKTLIEMLELPVKHSKIFAGAPLRLRSGVLLYGPPGCGKTHIVGAAASACSLRFISVKGPELLNKYIGASEQAVRDVFAKASAAAPCILFFDEFDAIAPKRGHDNTGVTDRVVNQFLTELDGVEALNGVFVFAATSRPDLLDAALLRPGRLDRLLFCNFPSTEERLEILQVLARKLPLSEDVNLEVLATLTEGFSGADLQALLSDAQLEAVHRFLNHSQSNQNSISTKAGCPLITMAVLSEAVKKARPSVPEREKRRLYEIYDVFLTGRSTVAGKTRDVKGKRVTLA